MQLEFSRQTCKQSSDIKFHQNPSIRNRVVPCGKTDGHDEANSRFLAILRVRLKSLKKASVVSSITIFILILPIGCQGRKERKVLLRLSESLSNAGLTGDANGLCSRTTGFGS
jgi:hypothetical protein